jgi:hypothetical protein
LARASVGIWTAIDVAVRLHVVDDLEGALTGDPETLGEIAKGEGPSASARATQPNDGWRFA